MNPKTQYLLMAAILFIAAMVNFAAADHFIAWHIARTRWLLERPYVAFLMYVVLGAVFAVFGVVHLIKGPEPHWFCVLFTALGIMFIVASRYFGLHLLQTLEAQLRQPEQLRAFFVRSSVVPLAFSLLLLWFAFRGTRP